MNKEDLIRQYNSNSIQEYDMQTGIRRKLEVYLGTKSIRGAENAIFEIILNSLDEFGAFPYTTLQIKYDTKTKIFSNFDTGRGIPLDKIEKILSSLHSGGKLDNSQRDPNKAYKKSRGSFGMGATIAVCVSDFFHIECHRDGKSMRIEYKDGYQINKVERDLNKNDFPHGTLIELKLSDEVFEDTNIDPRTFHEACEIISYASPGFQIELIIDNKRTKYFSQEGLIELYRKFVKERKILLENDPIKFVFDNTGFENTIDADAEIILGFDKKIGEKVLSFVNKYKTPEHGTHLTAVKTAITMALGKYINDDEKIAKKLSKFEGSASLINEFLVSIISIDMVAPSYENQTKDKLNSQEVIGWLKSKLYNAFLTWLTKNPKATDRLVKLVLLEAEARYAAKKAKEKIKGIDDKTNFINSSTSKRLEDCLLKDPSKIEVFIVEGESASVGSARDSNFQAYYLLRGKIFNVMASDKLENDVLLDFINMLGCGFGAKKDISKLRYHKIIILADADTDGLHIGSLVLGFFYKYYPELIENGNVYLGNPPLYTIEMQSGKKVQIKNNEHFNFFLVEIMKKRFDLYSVKSNKKVPEKAFTGFLYGLRNYYSIIENLAKQLNITPDLLEYIALYYKDIQKNNFKRFEKLGYKINILSSNEYEKRISFDEDIHHYHVAFNTDFYNNTYLPLITKIAKEICLYNVYLKDKETNKEIYGTLYSFSKMIDSLFEGKQIKSFKHNKGLGEMTPKDLAVSVVNPETRMLTRVTMKDAARAKKTIETFLGKSYPEDKKAYLEGKM